MTGAGRGFGSDNHAGVHPAVMAALAQANVGHAHSYGDDDWTRHAEAVVRAQLGEQAAVFPVFNGTGANVAGLSAVLRPWEAVICAASAHLVVDESTAPQGVGGFKLISVATQDGRLRPGHVEELAVRIGDEHAAQPRVVSVAQSTELGTVYSQAELLALADAAHERGMLLHVDGARLCNAAAALGASLREITTDAGADLLSLGATKCGGLGAEAVVFLRAGLGEEFRYVRKQKMQLASKMRFVSAQIAALYEDGLAVRLAGHANAMAARLLRAVQQIDGVTITRAVDANAVFAVLPPGVHEQLVESWFHYLWDERTGEVRWMTSWDTTEEDVDGFAADLARLCG